MLLVDLRDDENGFDSGARRRVRSLSLGKSSGSLRLFARTSLAFRLVALLLELPDELPRARGDRLRHLDLHHDLQRTSAPAIDAGGAFALDRDDLTRLRAGR